MSHIVKITSIEKINHDVLEIKTNKPEGYHFVPGQATEISINQLGWEDAKRPFTFTCLPKQNYLEFMIKVYTDREGVTKKLLELKVGDELALEDSWGDIRYKGEGVFIAGGAGITPFVSIFRDLADRHELGNNQLIFANKTTADIILREELTSLLNHNFINILSDEENLDYAHGRITEHFLRECGLDFNKYFYLCGPEPMMDAVEKQLGALGVKPEFIVKEAF